MFCRKGDYVQLMVLKSNAFVEQNIEQERLLEEFLLKNQQTLKDYPNLYPKFIDNKYVLAFKPYDFEALITVLKKLNLSKDMVIENVIKYGYENEMEYILNSLGFKMKSDNKIKVSQWIIKQAKYFEYLYSVNKECFIRLRNKSTGQYRAYRIEHLQDPYRLQAILKSSYFNNMNDMMYSLNLYNNMYKANEESLFSLQNIAVDLDFDTEKYTKRQVLNKLEKEFGVTIPIPNLIEHSHRIRLMYSIEDVAVTKKSLKVYKCIGDEIAKRIKEIGIEGSVNGQSATTFGRILNSVNTKDNSKVEVILKNIRVYKMKDMQMQLLDKPDWLKVVERTNINQDKKTYHIWNTYSLNMGRLEDLRKIQKIRQDGYKEILTYLYRNYCYLAGYSEEETFNMLIEFNNNFDNPRPLNKLDGDTKHLARKQYIHRSSSILEILDIEPKDEKNLNLTVTESAVEKRRRKITKQKEQYYQEIKKQGKN